MMKTKRVHAQKPESRMERHRAKRRLKGQKQITAFLSVEATSLLAQMVAFSGELQATLLSEAIHALAFDYERWGIEAPDELQYHDLFGPLGGYHPESSHYENDSGRLVENFGYRTTSAPPWIVEKERLDKAELESWRKDDAQLQKQRDDLSVYRVGISRNMLQKNK